MLTEVDMRAPSPWLVLESYLAQAGQLQTQLSHFLSRHRMWAHAQLKVRLGQPVSHKNAHTHTHTHTHTHQRPNLAASFRRSAYALSACPRMPVRLVECVRERVRMGGHTRACVQPRTCARTFGVRSAACLGVFTPLAAKGIPCDPDPSVGASAAVAGPGGGLRGCSGSAMAAAAAAASPVPCAGSAPRAARVASAALAAPSSVGVLTATLGVFAVPFCRIDL